MSLGSHNYFDVKGLTDIPYTPHPPDETDYKKGVENQEGHGGEQTRRYAGSKPHALWGKQIL